MPHLQAIRRTLVAMHSNATMIKLLFIFYFLDVGLALKAQFSNTQVFVDSCNTAITSYEDFLVNFRKSTDKFTQAKSTSGECYKLLLSYKANHILNIDNTTFTNLKVSLEGMKSLDLNQFLKVEKETKDKINIMTDRGTAYIAKQHAGILLALHLFKIDLEKLHASPILNLLNEALKFNDTYLLPFDSLKKRFSDKILIHDSDITYLTSRYRTYYDDTLTVRIQSLQEYSIFTQSPYRIDFFFLEKKNGKVRIVF